MLKLRLKEMPYTREGSYMVFSDVRENYRNFNLPGGFYFRTVHGGSENPLIARVELRAGGKAWERVSYEQDGTGLVLTDGEHTVEMVFDDPDTVLLRGSSGSEVYLDFLTELGPFDYIFPEYAGNEKRWTVNCFKNRSRYMTWVQKGKAEVFQTWEESTAKNGGILLSGEAGFLAVFREVMVERPPEAEYFDFDAVKARTDGEFLSYLGKTVSVPEKYSDERRMAAYLNWSSFVRKRGILPSDAMLMSKNWMANVWSWDHCFNALSMCYADPEAAFRQWIILYRKMDETGRVPDSINDELTVWNFVKPPIHGWALQLMRQHMTLTQTQTREAYDSMAKATRWWMRYRCFRDTGMYYYTHGNDSGWDNSTPFSGLPPVATPELQAFLVLQMEELASLAGEMGLPEEQNEWNREAKCVLETLLTHFFCDGKPVSIQVDTGKRISNRCLLPYEVLILGDRLPENLRQTMIETVLSEEFMTRYGLATESPKSVLYRPDGYWRGPIWAPSTFIMADALTRCGRRDAAAELAGKFADMASRSGFAENYDALTGEGLRDRAYTWTSSVFLVLAHEYL